MCPHPIKRSEEVSSIGGGGDQQLLVTASSYVIGIKSLAHRAGIMSFVGFLCTRSYKKKGGNSYATTALWVRITIPTAEVSTHTQKSHLPAK